MGGDEERTVSSQAEDDDGEDRLHDANDENDVELHGE